MTPVLAPQLIQPTVSVSAELQPYPHEGMLALAPLVLLLLAVSLLYAVKHRRAQRRRHGAGVVLGTLAPLALGAALGNALVELDTTLRAGHPTVVVMEPAEPTAAQISRRTRETECAR